tara:strand:- start:557 stop:751 length:195 start_codon:yes stop_codon:yes gene_type:complete
MTSSPRQTFGGIGLTSTFAWIFVAGFVNGIGKLPDKSVELHDTPNRMQDAAAIVMITRFIRGKG